MQKRLDLNAIKNVQKKITLNGIPTFLVNFLTCGLLSL